MNNPAFRRAGLSAALGLLVLLFGIAPPLMAPTANALPSTRSSGALVTALIIGLAVLVLIAAVIFVRRRHSAAGDALKARAKLDVLTPDMGRTTFAVTTAITTIGRAMDNSLVLNDTEVSGYHAELLTSAQGFILRDLKSTNGTFVNGRRITKQRLFPGDEITIGKTRITVGN
jgi:hypothetical protein